MSRVDLPSGGWAELRDAADVITVRQRKAIIAANERGDTFGEQATNLMEAVIAFAVTAWSYSTLLPSESIDVLNDLPIGDYDALVDATDSLLAALVPSRTKVEHPLDPKAEDSGSGS